MLGRGAEGGGGGSARAVLYWGIVSGSNHSTECPLFTHKWNIVPFLSASSPRGERRGEGELAGKGVYKWLMYECDAQTRGWGEGLWGAVPPH